MTDDEERRSAHAERRRAYRDKLAGRTRTPAADAPAHAHAVEEPSSAVFDLETPPETLRHRAAMRRVYREELKRARWYRDTWEIPFEESELAGYKYREPGDDD